MILNCESCGKRYMLKDGLIKKDMPKKVRCTSCGHTWLEKAEPETLHEDFAPFVSERIVIEQKDNKFVILFSTLFLVTVCTIIILNRSDIVKYVPITQKIYELLNLSTQQPGEGLKVSDVHCITEVHNGQKYIYVIGTITNTTKDVVQVPQVEFHVVGASANKDKSISQKKIDGKLVLHSWKMKLTENKLLAGEKIQFESDKIQLPPGAQSVIVRF